MKTIDLLEALRSKFGGATDYRVAKEIGVRQQVVSLWRTGTIMSDSYGIRVADVLGMNRAYVIACLHAERAEGVEDESGVWRQIADAFRSHAAGLAAVALFGFSGFAPSPAQAAGLSNSQAMYIMLRRYRSRRLFPQAS